MFEKMLVKHFVKMTNLGFDISQINRKEALDIISYDTLLEIKKVLDNFSISDEEKLIRIEKIYNDWEFI